MLARLARRHMRRSLSTLAAFGLAAVILLAPAMPSAAGQAAPPPSIDPFWVPPVSSPDAAADAAEGADSLGFRPLGALMELPTLPGFGASASGQAMPLGDLPGWRQVFADDFPTGVPLGGFPGAAYASAWSVYPDGWPDTTHNGTYMPSKVLSVANGMLDYYVHTENGVHMVAAPLPKLAGTDVWGAKFGSGTSVQGQTYGRYSVRYRSDALHGYKTAWLLWPDSEQWPADGEIDFPEGNLDGTISAFAHHADSAGGEEAFPTDATFGAWHTSTTEWLPGRINSYLDGVLIGTTTAQVPSKPMHWVLQAETTLDGYAPADGTAGHVQIDWVVAYAPA